IFFFQAEDGIRDFHVTGVQTCALPIFAARTPQALVARATPRALRELGLVVEEAAAGKPVAEDTFVGEAVVGGAVSEEAESVAGKDPLDTLAGALLAAELTAAGALPAPGERLPAATTAQRLAVQPAHRRLFEALLPVLERAGAVRRDGSDLVGTGPVPVPAVAVPEAEEDLLRRCTAALPDVLAGRRNPLEVLFP